MNNRSLAIKLVQSPIKGVSEGLSPEDTMNLTPGEIYRVVRDGARLSKEVSVAPSAWKDKSVPLPVGSEITFVGMKMGWGSDSIPLPNFRFKDFEGEFWPNDWGRVDASYLEDV